MKPLVSILIPAYNAEETIGYTVESAIAQTWGRKEIIVVDDGSTDLTAEVARRFASKGVAILQTENGGISAAVNNAFRACHGDYIQELDSDDLMLPNKIESQLAGLREGDSRRILLSSPWAPFYYRTIRTRFVRDSLCEDLKPVEWLLRKMGENLHMQNATWLVSRELAEAAGPWDESLTYDQDGEYFARLIVKSEGTRFVDGTGIFYRDRGPGSISYIGRSNNKRESLYRSIKLHIQYLRSLEESERVRNACLTYLQNWFGVFYPDRPDLIAELKNLAAELGGGLNLPRLGWKYAWMKPVFGRRVAEWARRTLPAMKSSFLRHWDKAMFNWETREAADDDAYNLENDDQRE